MKIALAQLNPTVGDLRGNLRKHLDYLHRAKDAHADIIVFPELSILGYPQKDLLLKPALADLCAQTINELAQHAIGITALVGTIEKNPTNTGRPLYNAVNILSDGQILARRYKSLLPSYDVFDEPRYFEPGTHGNGGDSEIVHLSPCPLVTPSPPHPLLPVGISICEDLWNDEKFIERPLYHFHPIETLAQAGAKILFNISASPFTLAKNEYRQKLFSFQAKRWQLPIIYVNQVGANDELIFDGNSAIYDHQGNIIAQAKDFEEDLLIADVPHAEPRSPGEKNELLRVSAPPRELPPRTGIASIHAALVLGIRDYIHKSNLKSVILGLSGGLDSAVVAALAVEALGPQNVTGISLPSRYSSDHSKSDAAALAKNLNIRFETIPLESAHHALESTLAPLFANTPEGLAEENIQARFRGIILMALSNKFGHMLLTTGNKSETAVGYCTLYGDTCGGLAPLADLPKTMVYQLAHHINTSHEIIPQNTITKPPSAELKPNQTDQDSLPPYAILDAIIEQYVEQNKTPAEIIAGGGGGFDPTTVTRVARLIDLSEHKRKQLPPGLKLTPRAFGSGRRMPIAQAFTPPT